VAKPAPTGSDWILIHDCSDLSHQTVAAGKRKQKAKQQLRLDF
jgi:hypothetical protein